MKKALITLLALTFLLAGLAACGGAPAPAPSAPAATDAPAAERPMGYDGITFSTTGLDGTEWDESVFMENTLTMINFWEHWCPPCVRELPALQQLSETYASQGFRILGVFSDTSDMDSVRARVEAAGVTYPILYYTAEFEPFLTGYVPTTVFVDSNGQLVGEPIAGSMDYDDWAALVESLL